jgi:undecaprenyl-diphosphatase
MDVGQVADALVLGVVEGVTEFLPVSSTAHLLLVGRLLGFHSPGNTFVVLIQLGAILAVLAAYVRRLFKVVVTLPSDPASRRFVIGLVLASVPAAVVGAAARDYITNTLYGSLLVIAAALILGGFVLMWVDRLDLRPSYHDAMDLPIPIAVTMGVFQTLALIPGVSRSGATISAGLLIGCDKRTAAEYSFFMAIPVMVGAFVLDFYKNRALLDFSEIGLIAIGFVAAFVSALVVVETLLGFVSRHGFEPFAWWRLVVGAATLAALLVYGG